MFQGIEKYIILADVEGNIVIISGTRGRSPKVREIIAIFPDIWYKDITPVNIYIYDIYITIYIQHKTFYDVFDVSRYINTYRNVPSLKDNNIELM